ncbi:MAG TPA: hypothetical protein VJO99_27110 [Burkholderiaceae bacterium]|nr:hypothetical protein [Burkholderiaceae bacterium]
MVSHPGARTKPNGQTTATTTRRALDVSACSFESGRATSKSSRLGPAAAMRPNLLHEPFVTTDLSVLLRFVSDASAQKV